MGDGEVAEGQAGSGVENASAQEALSYLTLTKWDDFLRDLSVDSRAEEGSLVMVAARSMWSSALPPNWSEQIDEEHSRAYFFNRVSGESVWVHPQSDVFRELIEEVRRWPPDESVDHIVRLRDEHLRRAHQAAVDALAQWSAYDVPQGPEEAPEFGECTRFFFNATTNESRWSDPRESLEFALAHSSDILASCVDAHSQNLARMASSEPFERTSVPRPLFLRAGDETGRSGASYLTARSCPDGSPRTDFGVLGATPQGEGDMRAVLSSSGGSAIAGVAAAAAAASRGATPPPPS